MKGHELEEKDVQALEKRRVKKAESADIQTSIQLTLVFAHAVSKTITGIRDQD
jgi:hypothetical protein